MLNDQNRMRRNIFLHLQMPPQYKCVECRRSMSIKNHFVKCMQFCSQCSYGTQCHMAFESHLQQHDSSLQGSLDAREDVFRKQEVLDLATIQCSCGFETRFGNKYCKHVTQCLLSDKSVVKEWRPSKAASKFLPVKMQESLGLIRRFNICRFRSSKALSTSRKRIEMRKKRRTLRSDNHPFDNYSQCCSKLDQYSLILAQKVSNIDKFPDISASFGNICKKTLLLAILPKNKRPSIRSSKVPSPALSEELPFSLEEWDEALAQFSRQHSSSISNNTSDDTVQKYKNNFNDHNDDLNFIPYPESIIM